MKRKSKKGEDACVKKIVTEGASGGIWLETGELEQRLHVGQYGKGGKRNQVRVLAMQKFPNAGDRQGGGHACSNTSQVTPCRGARPSVTGSSVAGLRIPEKNRCPQRQKGGGPRERRTEEVSRLT